MTNWGALREALADVKSSRTFAWVDLETLVGPLPKSAYEHRAFWSDARAAWKGFRTTDVIVRERVTFVRQGREYEPNPAQPVATPASPVDILLMTCVKEKLDRPARARELYISPLFQKERAYAEASGLPWFILSAEHGLVAPDEWLAPYELHLPDTPASYRTAWGERVVERLALVAGTLPDRIIEVHASSKYVDTIRAPLNLRGAVLVEPLRGLPMGKRLAWYTAAKAGTESNRPGFVDRLRCESEAVSPGQFVARGANGLRKPGLYSWWVDETGAAELSLGLGSQLESGLIYAGSAGATKWPSGTRSGQTLWSRIKGNHIGGRHQGSTFRLSLGSVVGAARRWRAIDESALTAWMHEHLRVIAAPHDNADELGALEEEVLQALDPPLNIMGMAPTGVRNTLTQLRRTYGEPR